MEFAPASRGRAKPITKAQLRKLQSAYETSDKLLSENLEKEAMEKEKTAKDMDDLFANL